VFHAPQLDARRQEQESRRRAGETPRHSPTAGALDRDVSLGAKRRAGVAAGEVRGEQLGTFRRRRPFAAHNARVQPVDVQRRGELVTRARLAGDADTRTGRDRVGNELCIRRPSAEASHADKTLAVELQDVRSIFLTQDGECRLSGERRPERERRGCPCRLRRCDGRDREARALGRGANRIDEPRRRGRGDNRQRFAATPPCRQ
jgi:hypothetical protein